MGDVINLKRFKKKLEREQMAKHAEENRARHGRTKIERQRDRETNQKREATLDLHRLSEDER